MRKWIALAGLAVLGVGGYYVVESYATAIPQKLKRLATEQLGKVNIVTVSVEMDGLDAALVGTVPTADQREVAASVVARVSGVRNVDSSALEISAPDRGPGEPAAEVALDLDVTWEDGRLQLKGQVQGRALEQRIGQKIAQTFGGAQVTRTLLVREGTPELQDELIRRVVAGLEALAMTSRGTLVVTDTGVTLNGTVGDDATREQMTALLKSQVSPQGELALSVVVAPPVIAPGESDAAVAGDDVLLGEDAAVGSDGGPASDGATAAEADGEATTDTAPTALDADALATAVDTVLAAVDTTPAAADTAVPVLDGVAGGAPAGVPPRGVTLSATTPLDEEVCDEVLWWLVEGDKHIVFDRKKQIAPESEATVAQVAQVLKRCGAGKVMIEGFTDAYGEPDELRATALRWAQNVKKRLVELGLPESRLLVKSYGYNRPRYPDKPNTRLLNRRIEFKVKGVK